MITAEIQLEILELLKSAIISGTDLPKQIFRPAYRRFQFVEHSLVTRQLLQTLLRRSLDETCFMSVIDPVTHFQSEANYGVYELSIHSFERDYAQIPSSDLNSVIWDHFWFPKSLRWVLREQLHGEMTVIAYRQDLEVSGESDGDRVRLLTPETALEIASPAWSDRAARVQFAKELMANYGDNRPWLDDAHQRALEIAMKALSGELGFIEASISLSSMSYEVMPDLQQLFDPFEEISRKTEDFPMGVVRDAWEPKALAKKDAEIASFTRLFRQQTLNACQALIDHLGS